MFVLLWHRQNHEYQKYDVIPIFKKGQSDMSNLNCK